MVSDPMLKLSELSRGSQMMTKDASNSRPGGFSGLVHRLWCRVLDTALILWIVRVPLAATALGYLILKVTPQAQDLFVEFADALSYVVHWATSHGRDLFTEAAGAIGHILLFLIMLFFVWAVPTHYSARLLLDTDRRFQSFVLGQSDPAAKAWLNGAERWIPRILGTRHLRCRFDRA